MMTMFNFGQAIKELRQSKGLSQKELSSGICTQAQISKIEKNNDVPSVFILVQIAKALGVDMDYFFEMQEAHKGEYLKESKKHIRQLTYLADYKELSAAVLAEKKHPYFQEKRENIQFLLWHEAICIHYLNDDSEQALAMLDEALKMTRDKQYYTEQEVEILNSKAIILREIEKLEESENSFREALKKFREVPKLTDPNIEIRIIFALSQCLTDIGKFQESLEYCEEGINLCKKLESIYLLAKLKYQHGENLARLGNRDEAIQSFKQCLDLFELEENSQLVQIVLENIYDLLGIDDISKVIERKS